MFRLGFFLETAMNKSKYTVTQLKSMARTVMMAKNSGDERYIFFVSMLSQRTGFQLEHIERVIAIMAKRSY